MKYFILPLLFLPFFSRGQSFSVDVNFCDSLSNGSFRYHVSGEAQFSDSMVVLIELRSNDSLQTVIFSGVKDFQNASNTTLNTFAIDEVTGSFNVELTELPTNQVYLFIRSTIEGEVKEEILLPAFVSL